MSSSDQVIYLTSYETLSDNEYQICYLPSSIIKMLKLERVCQINLEKNQNMICKPIPITNTCSKAYQALASCQVMCDIYNLENFNFEKEIIIKMDKIKKLTLVDIIEATVSIVMNSAESCIGAKKSFKNFKKDIFNLLKFYNFRSNCIINCEFNGIAKQLGIKFIIISYVKFENNGNESCTVGIMKPLTILKIEKIESQEKHKHLVHSQTHLGGLDSILDDMKKLILEPFKNQKAFKEAGASYPRGVLLIGPPGSGKSSLVHQLCYEIGACLIVTTGVDLKSPYEGETLRNLEKITNKACLLSKEGICVLFIDEIDSICPARTAESTVEEIQLTAEVLLALDECKKYPQLVVMAATNRPFDLDGAVRCSGRLILEIMMSTPTVEERKGIIAIHTKGFLPDASSLLCKMALATPGFVGADLKLLCDKIKEKFSATDFSDANSDSLMSSKILAMCSSICPSIYKNLDFITKKPISSPVGGLYQVKEKLNFLMTIHSKYPKFYDKFNLKKPKGILFYGPRGCGKTRLVSMLASQKGFTFLSANASHLLSPYVGESEKRVVALFQAARLSQPSIVFIDEIDGIFGDRDSLGKGVNVNLVTELLQAMDGADIGTTSVQGSSVMGKKLKPKETNILVCAATNNPHKLDSALLRPGRFDCIFYIPPPNRQERLQILMLKTSKLKIDSNLLEEIANKTENWTGAELEYLISQAAVKSLLEGPFAEKQEIITIRESILWKEFDKISPSLTAKEIRNFKEFERKINHKLQFNF